MATSQDIGLCKALLKLGLASKEVLQAVLREAVHRPVEDLLLEKGIVGPEDIERARAIARDEMAPAAARRPARGRKARAGGPSAGPRPARPAGQPATAIWVTGAAALVVVAVVVVFLVVGLGGGRDGSTTPGEPDTAAKGGPGGGPSPGPSSPDTREVQASRALQRVAEVQPLPRLIEELESVARTYSDTRAGAEALERVKALLVRLENEARGKWKEAAERIAELDSRMRFHDIVALCDKLIKEYGRTETAARIKGTRDANLERINKAYDNDTAEGRKHLAEGRHAEAISAFTRILIYGDPDQCATAKNWIEVARKDLERAQREKIITVAKVEPEEKGPGTTEEGPGVEGKETAEGASSPGSTTETPGPGVEEPGAEVEGAPPEGTEPAGKVEGKAPEEGKSGPEPPAGPGVTEPPTPSPDDNAKRDSDKALEKALKGVLSASSVSVKGGMVTLVYRFSNVDDALTEDWLPPLSRDRANVRWWGEWEYGRYYFMEGLRIADSGTYLHKVVFLPDVDVTVQYYNATRQRVTDFMLLGYFDADGKGHGVGANLGMQALEVTRYSRPVGGEPKRMPDLEAATRPYDIRFKLRNQVCTVYYRNRRRADYQVKRAIDKGHVGFAWGTGIVGGIEDVTIKGRIDPEWLKEHGLGGS